MELQPTLPGLEQKPVAVRFKGDERNDIEALGKQFNLKLARIVCEATRWMLPLWKKHGFKFAPRDENERLAAMLAMNPPPVAAPAAPTKPRTPQPRHGILRNAKRAKRKGNRRG